MFDTFQIIEYGFYAKMIVDTISKYCEFFIFALAIVSIGMTHFPAAIHGRTPISMMNIASSILLSSIISERISITDWSCAHKKHFDMDSNQPLIFELEEVYACRCILINDVLLCESTTIRKYNDRGTFEKKFDIQNNDFGWSHMPLSFMNENVIHI